MANPGAEDHFTRGFKPFSDFPLFRETSKTFNRAHRLFLVDTGHPEKSHVASWPLPAESSPPHSLVRTRAPLSSSQYHALSHALEPCTQLLSTGRLGPSSPAPVCPTHCLANSSFQDSSLGTVLPPPPMVPLALPWIIPLKAFLPAVFKL